LRAIQQGGGEIFVFLASYPFYEFTDSHLFRPHAFDRGEETIEDVVEAVELAGALDRKEVRHLRDDAEDRAVTSSIPADAAASTIAHHSAVPASANAIAYHRELLNERSDLLMWLTKEVEGVPLRRLRPDAWESPEAINEILDD
jgi:hypothetical protein